MTQLTGTKLKVIFFALPICCVVYILLALKMQNFPTQFNSKFTNSKTDDEEDLIALPRLNVSLLKKCDAYNELRDVNFLHPALKKRLCSNTPAYELNNGRFPLCQLSNNLTRLLYEEVNKTARIAPVQRALRDNYMHVYTFSDQDFISRNILNSKNWETDQIQWILKILKIFGSNLVTFLDIGSNFGLYSLQAREEGFPVIGLDANIRTLLRVQLSAKGLGIPLDEHLKLFWCFVDEEVALKHMNWVTQNTDCHIGGASSGSTNWLFPDSALDTIPVMTARTDDLLPHIKTKKVVVKMDIESGEYMFLKTGVQLFKNFDVMVLQMEFWRKDGAKPQDSPYFRLVTTFMISRNYSLISARSHSLLDVTTFNEWDGIWVRNDIIEQLLKL